MLAKRTAPAVLFVLEQVLMLATNVTTLVSLAPETAETVLWNVAVICRVKIPQSNVECMEIVCVVLDKAYATMQLLILKAMRSLL